MGLFDKFKKKNSETTAPVEQQAPASTQQVGTGVAQTPNAGINQQPITQETGLNAIAPETGMLADNPFVEAPSVDLVEDKIIAPTAPNFDNIFNVQPSDLIATPEPTLDTNNVVPNLYDTGARIDTPNPIVEQQIALDVHPDEVFEGGNTKEDEITRIVANSVNQNAQPQDFASPSINVNPVEPVVQPEPIQPAPVAEPTPQVVELTPQPQDFVSPSINVNPIEPAAQPELVQPAPVAETTPQVVEVTQQPQDFVSPSININPIEPVVQPATVQPAPVAEPTPQVVELTPQPQDFASPSVNVNPIEAVAQPEPIQPAPVAEPVPQVVEPTPQPQDFVSPSINVNPVEPVVQPEPIQPAPVAEPVPQVVELTAQPQDFVSPSVNVNSIEAVAQPEPIQPAPVAEPVPQVVEPTPQPQDFVSPSVNVNPIEAVAQPEPIQPAPVAELTPQVVELTPQPQDFVSPSVNVNPIEPVVQPATVQPTEVAEPTPQVVELSPEPQIVEATQKPQEFVSPSINTNPIESTVQPEVIPPTEVAQPTALSESTIEETIPNIPFGVTAPSNPEPINAENQNIAKDTFTSTPELISPSINVNPIEPAAQPEIIQPAGVAQPVPQIVDLTPQPQTHESLNINTNDVVEPTIPDSINSDQPMPADNVEESLTQQDNLQNLNESTQGTENAIQQEQILRDENTKTKFCDYCGTMVNQYTAICPNCGEAIK